VCVCVCVCIYIHIYTNIGTGHDCDGWDDRQSQGNEGGSQRKGLFTYFVFVFSICVKAMKEGVKEAVFLPTFFPVLL